MANKYTSEEYLDLVNILFRDSTSLNFSYVTHLAYECKLRFCDSVKYSKKLIKKQSVLLYKVMYGSKLNDLPLYINDTEFCIQSVIKWRLKIGK